PLNGDFILRTLPDTAAKASASGNPTNKRGLTLECAGASVRTQSNARNARLAPSKVLPESPMKICAGGRLYKNIAAQTAASDHASPDANPSGCADSKTMNP